MIPEQVNTTVGPWAERGYQDWKENGANDKSFWHWLHEKWAPDAADSIIKCDLSSMCSVVSCRLIDNRHDLQEQWNAYWTLESIATFHNVAYEIRKVNMEAWAASYISSTWNLEGTYIVMSNTGNCESDSRGFEGLRVCLEEAPQYVFYTFSKSGGNEPQGSYSRSHWPCIPSVIHQLYFARFRASFLRVFKPTWLQSQLWSTRRVRRHARQFLWSRISRSRRQSP